MLTIRSGATVAIDTLSHSGATQDEDPSPFSVSRGVRREEVLQDAIDFWASRPAVRARAAPDTS